MENKKILIYGANGYTAKLFANHLLKNNIQPILAARSSKVQTIGQKLNCSTRIFSIDNAEEQLQDIDFLVNLAGPFSITQEKLIQACINSKTHYLDIAGEYTEVKKAFQFHEEASQNGIVVLPAAGFGVVPTDIAATLACEQVNNPTHLKIAYATVGGASRGTLKTVLKDIQKSGHILVNGEYQRAKPAERELTITVFGKPIRTVYNPWRADLFTAYQSTDVKNIETYSEFPSFVVSMMKGKLTWLRNLILNRFINFLPEGPTGKQLQKGSTYIKAIAKNSKGDEGIVEIQGPEAYLFTVICIQKMIELISENESVKGFITPSQLGTKWILETERIIVENTAHNKG
jgi:short subunit dehydrogenase-like uncharacterized protein